jgi:hypothetical protein
LARLVIAENDLGTINPELAAQWHPTKNGSLSPQDVTVGSTKKVWWICSLRHEWDAVINDRSAGSGCPTCVGKRVLVGFNDLGTASPELAAEWHPTKNGPLTPQQVTTSSNKKVSWICAKLHDWDATISSRKGSGCPKCSGRVPIVGSTDLATVNPELSAQWHPTKNGPLTPQDVMAGSGKKVWWTCSLSHEWEAAIYNRSNGRGCPVCAGRLIQIGFNDLAEVNPELASQWHPTKNVPLTPQHVTVSSNKMAWWRCPLLHEWQALITSRSKGYGCPTCAGRIVQIGITDLATVNPALAAQWHPTKNKPMTPHEVTAVSGKSVWWICALLHEWEAKISNRSNGNGCPKCSGRVPVVGSTDLATVNPKLSSQWHSTANGALTPQDVTPGSDRKVWWNCALLHEWEAQIIDRTNGNGCPICSGRLIKVGFNDLATANPRLAAQWHPVKNKILSPQDVTQWSNRKVWWICPRYHEWETTINNRSQGNGCSKCSIGVTEENFREAFKKSSGLNFESNRIDLIRFSRKLNRAQIDMLNDSLKLVIEYDGEWTHGARSPEGKILEKKLAEDKETTQALVDIDYKVIRIREHSRQGHLPFISLDSEYESSVFQITYKSFGKDKDDIENLVQKIIKEKKEWFS